MRRTLFALVAVAVLLGISAAAERRLQGVEREDPMGRRLLYLPSAEMLRLASLGNSGFVADLLYLWSIQYYGQYRPHERFLYLDTVYQLITDLDPRFHDAYRIGALIMQLPTTDEAANKQAVIELYDKAMRNMPDDWEIGEAAAWDMYIRYHDKDQGLRYLRWAVGIPGSPHRLKRFLGAWSEDEEGWSFDDAIAYWTEVRDEATTDYDRAVSDKQIYRLVAARDAKRLDPLLQRWQRRTGHCPSSWAPLVDAGWLQQVPVDYFGETYRIVPDPCSSEAVEGVRFH